MKTPRTLSEALKSGFTIKCIYGKGNKRVRVDVQSRNFRGNGNNFFSYWLTSKYVERNYQNAFASC